MELWGESMGLNKEKLEREAYSPYRKEAQHCFTLFVFSSLLICILSCVLSAIFNRNLMFLFIFALLINSLLECILNFRIAIRIFFEKRMCEWNTSEIIITKVEREYSASGPWLEGSVLPKLYSADQHVDRYKLICMNRKGKKLVLRTVLSLKKYRFIQERIFAELPMECVVHYGKYSKIVMFYQSKEDWCDKLNHMF